MGDFIIKKQAPMGKRGTLVLAQAEAAGVHQRHVGEEPAAGPRWQHPGGSSGDRKGTGARGGGVNPRWTTIYRSALHDRWGSGGLPRPPGARAGLHHQPAPEVDSVVVLVQRRPCGGRGAGWARPGGLGWTPGGRSSTRLLCLDSPLVITAVPLHT